MRQLATLLILSSASLFPQSFDFYARGPYEPKAPRPESVIGHAIGNAHTYHYQMESYIHALAAASPRVKVIPYGASYEGRKTYLVMVSSEENIGRLEEVRGAIARLKDPRQTSEAEAKRIAASTPAIVWLNYANDGNESAAFEAGMQMAYQMAAGEDAETRLIRQRVVTIVDPAHNPESHDRFVAWYNAVHGKNGNPDRAAAEHAGDWLMDSNDNHYHIDLNRDAFALTQKETREIVAAIHRWNPQVFIDHHGNPPIFFFPPVALPMNQNYPESTAHWEEVIGKGIAQEFGKYGWSFMNREVFDLFYPGYYDSYPALNGATGMTFETDGGGNQGLRLERADKTISTLKGGIAKHFSAGYAVLKATAENKDQRLLDYYQFRKSGMEEGDRGPMKQFVLLRGRRPDQSAALVSLLLRHEVEVWRAGAAFEATKAHSYLDSKAGNREFPEGSYVIPMNQPQKRLIQALLEPDAKLQEAFLKLEKAKWDRNQRLGRRAARERDGFYDITAWSLPLSYGVETYWTEDRAGASAKLERVSGPPQLGGGVEGGRASYAYLIPNSNGALRLVGALLQEDFRVAVARAEFRIGGETWGGGTFLARVERNPETLHQRIAQLAAQNDVRIRAVNTPWTDGGISLGSPRIVDLKKPRIAVAAYEPTMGRAFGALWFLFEQMLDYPFTPIPTKNFRNVDLSKYEVIVFPDGSDAEYQEELGAAGVARLKAWIENGGVFVGLKRGAAFAARRGVEWTTSRLIGRREEPQTAATAPAPQPPPPPAQQPQQPPAKQEPPEKEVDRTPGAMVRAEFNMAHFLTLGYEPEQVVMHNSDLIFTSSRDGTQVATYAKENLRVSGFIWPETEKRLAGSPYAIAEKLGRGHVILFADDPNFRLLWPRLTRLFMNAVWLAPSVP